jgi:hypothetical protein
MSFAANSPMSPRSLIQFRIAIGAAFLMLMSLATDAEESQPVQYAFLSGYGSRSSMFEEESLWFAQAGAPKNADEHKQLFDDEQVNDLFRIAAHHNDSTKDLSIGFFRNSSARFASALRKLRTGFGQFFRGDTIGRSRASGAGVEDPDCFYLKMSFRF